MKNKIIDLKSYRPTYENELGELANLSSENFWRIYNELLTDEAKDVSIDFQLMFIEMLGYDMFKEDVNEFFCAEPDLARQILQVYLEYQEDLAEVEGELVSKLCVIIGLISEKLNGQDLFKNIFKFDYPNKITEMSHEELYNLSQRMADKVLESIKDKEE